MRGQRMVRQAAGLVAALLVGFTATTGTAGAARSWEPSGPKPQVIGGSDVADGTYPFMAALLNEKRRGTDFDKQFCGGTLVAPTWVLTAAHCVTNDNGRPLSTRNLAVAVGRTVLSSNQGERFAVSEVRVHPQYQDASWISHDAALLRLSGTSTRTPVRLAGAADDTLEAAGTTLTVAGWGTTCYPDSCWPDRMQHVDVPVVSDADCVAAYGSTDLHAATSVCAGAEGIDTCSGDSGGPLFDPESSGFVQVGITSWGEGCALAGSPGVYGEVNNPDVRSWITSVAGV